MPDLDEAERFYGAVFGWAFEDNPMGKSITHRGVVIGGASAVKAALDTHWIVELGGTAEDPVPWQSTAGYALVRDTQGAPFAIHAA